LRSDTIAPLIASLQPERTTQNWQQIPLLLISQARAEEVHQPIKAPEVQTLEEIGYQPKEARHADKKNASSNKDAEKADKERLRRLKSPMLVGAKNQRARRHR
jgi:Holliday junction resolvasome RuvABC DNA-binding subunit